MIAAQGSNTDGRAGDDTIATRTLRLNTEEAEIRRMAEAIEGFASQHGVPGKAIHQVILSAD